MKAMNQHTFKSRAKNHWRECVNQGRIAACEWKDRAIKEYRVGNIEAARLAARFHREAIVSMRRYQKLADRY